MRLPSLLTALAGLLSASVTTAQSATAQPARPTAFADVRVETMTEQGAIERGWVVIENGRITALGDGPLPADFAGERIDGGGATLMPGLMDMHVHYYDDGFGPLFLANSITGVRNLTGSLQSAVRNREAELGSLVGPRVHTSGPIIDGGEPVPNDFFVRAQTPDQAVGAVRSQAASGYRAVKLYSHLSEASYRAAAAEARARQLRIFSHVPDSMTVTDLLALKIDSIEHLDGYARRWRPPA